MQTIAQAVRKIRTVNKITQQDIAKLLNIPRSTYAYIEKKDAYTVEQLIFIADYFGVDFGLLCQGEVSKTQKSDMCICVKNREEKQLLEMYNKLSFKKKKLLFSLISLIDLFK